MKIINTEILVIGGGATGIGTVRDLAMRGFKTALVEKRDFSHGTSGRYHGLLHSGGRYVVKDPSAARECIEENRILRKIMPQCIEDTGGFFVITPWDNPDYVDLFLTGCQRSGVPVEKISITQMLKNEPLLNPRISDCFHVPDGAADSFLAAHLNLESAKQYNAQIFNYHQVNSLIIENHSVQGACCIDLTNGEEVTIHSDMVVNAAGAWCGKIAAMAGVEVKIIPGKGVMLATNHRIVNTVINRCKMPSDGDILVPAHTVSVIGTTDVKVDDPDLYGIEPWEVHLMLDEGEKIVPGFKNMRMVRAWAGVRPLYQETSATTNRDVTRAFVLIDHIDRDGLDGLVTITSGKWTTYRKMAEVTTDLVCRKLNSHQVCRTHQESLPGTIEKKYHQLGDRLNKLEKNQGYGQLICECELATVEDIKHSIIDGNAQTLDDIRRDTRLGMGPCQGGFCSIRAIGILHSIKKIPIEKCNAFLRDFIQERWKGLKPILWGQQLQQQRLDELIFSNLLNIKDLPGPSATSLAPDLYQDYPRKEQSTPEKSTITPPKISNNLEDQSNQLDIVIIGGGFSGLVAGWQAAKNGKHIRVITKGWGTTHWHSGCVDVLNTQNNENLKPAIEELIRTKPNHPYAIVGIQNLVTALDAFKLLCASSNYPLEGSLEHNWLLPTALGSFRPTCLAPVTMVAGNLNNSSPVLLLGIENYYDFSPCLAAENFKARGIPSICETINTPHLKSKRFITNRVLAELFEIPEFRQEFISEIRQVLSNNKRMGVKRIGLPAVLGINNSWNIHKELESHLEMQVFEIPTLPPSIPGIRLHNLLIRAIRESSGRVFEGMQVISAEFDEKKIHYVSSEAASRKKIHRAYSYVLATGGFLGGGFTLTPEQLAQELIFNLPITMPAKGEKWFNSEFLSTYGHPLNQCGIQINQQFHPIDQNNNRLYENLYCIGSTLAHYDPIVEKSLEGVAISTGFVVGNQINIDL